VMFASRRRPREPRRAVPEGRSIAVRVSAPSRWSVQMVSAPESQTLRVSGSGSPRAACVQKLSRPEGLGSLHPRDAGGQARFGPRGLLQVMLRLSPQPSHAWARLASGARPNGPFSHAKSAARPATTGRMAAAPTGVDGDSGFRSCSMPLGRIGDRAR
jgi:hypothetical protein